MIPLEKEFDFFVNNQKNLVEKFKGKYIVIKNGRVLGAYNSPLEGIEETSKHEELGTFLIQKCAPTKKAYTQHYHSRVNFDLK